MPFRILKTNKGYFVENIETGKKYSKKPMSEEKAKRQFNILNRYLRTLEGSGLNKGEIKEIREEPLTDADIKKYLPSSKIISHQDLKKYSSIEELLPHNKDVVIIIYETKPNYGHWVMLARYNDPDTNKPTIEYFDSYANKIDAPLKWIDKDYKDQIDKTPYLHKLLERASDRFDIVYNAKDFQKENPNIATCGRHCVLRALSILKNNQGLSDYIKLMNEMKDVTGFSYDDIASSLIDI